MADGTSADGLHVSRHEIGALTEAALEGRFQPAVLDLVAARLPGAATLLYRQDSAQPAACGILHRGLGGQAMPGFPARLARDNPLFVEHRRCPVGAVFHDGALLAREMFRASAFYRDWLALAGDFDAATGVVIAREGPVQTVLEIRYPAHAERRTAAAAETALTELAPHLAQAARIADLTLGAEQAQIEARNFLELGSFPTFIVDPDCRIHTMNGRGEVLLRLGGGLVLGMDRTLQAAEPADTARLQEAVTHASLSVGTQSAMMRLSAPPARKVPRVLSLTPLSALSRTDLPCGGGCAHQGRVAILAIDAADPLRLGRDALWAMFNLTAREAELALSLLEGRTLPEMAQAQAISKQTLRNQLSSILRKTGTTRQSELVALLLQIARARPL
jgi:DNA-binding CsgD family transcriptional regulator